MYITNRTFVDIKKAIMGNMYKETKFENFVWIDISQPETIKMNDFAKQYKLDYLQVIDSLEIGHLPKYEKQDKYTFLILRAFTAKLNDRITNINELSNKIAFFYNDNKLITIHRGDFPFMENTNAEFANSQELLIHLVSKMVDTFIEPSNMLSNKVDSIEKTIFLQDYSKISLEDLYYQKSETRISKKLLQITQNVINQIEVDEVRKSALQDIKDSLLSLILSYDEVLEDSNNLLNTYLSVNSQKSNDVMKLLTIFSAFFLPLTFIAGVYGMNFKNMPELEWESGYFIILIIMAILAISIYIWFKREKIIK